jgi:threonine/homoserine/homoserine lactone efflux protein
VSCPTRGGEADVVVPELSVLAAFLVAGLVLNLTPGVDMAYVVGTTARWGTRAGASSAVGIALGSLCHVVLAAAGLSALVAASPVAMMAVTIVGAAYLVWSGVRMIVDAGPAGSPETPGVAPPGGPGVLRLVGRGALVNLLNVKVVVFYLAFLPQFVRPDHGPAWQQIVLFGLLFDLMGTAVLVAVAVVAGWGVGRRRDSGRSGVVVRRVCGAVLVVMALSLTVSRLVAG